DWLQPEPFLGGLGRTWPYLLRGVVNHSLPVLPTAQWQRVLVGTWLIYCFILTTAYTANLIAFLTIPVFPERIQTLEELAQSDYRLVMCDYGEFVPGALMTSENKVYKALGDKLDLFIKYDEVITYLLSGTHAFIESYSYGKIILYAYYKVTNSYMLKDQLYPGHLCWYFQKNTAWKYKFDQGIKRLVEAGLVSYWFKMKSEDVLGQDYVRLQQQAGEEQHNERPLSVEHLQGVFLILLFSQAASVAVFFLELLLDKCHGGRP
ncbi:Glutamate receptor ionotropic, kainate 4-like 7, partial [Homarus americanus]